MRGLIAIVANPRICLLLGLPILVARGLMSMLVLTVCAAGLVSKSKRVHGALAVVGLAQVMGNAYLWLQPGVLTIDISP